MSANHAKLNRWRLAATHRAYLAAAATAAAPCALCGQPINYSLDGRTKWGPTVDHHPSLASGLNPDPYDHRWMRPAHRHCNCIDGRRLGNRLHRGLPAQPAPLNTGRDW